MHHRKSGRSSRGGCLFFAVKRNSIFETKKIDVAFVAKCASLIIKQLTAFFYVATM
jgi:hypothetical protein